MNWPVYKEISRYLGFKTTIFFVRNLIPLLRTGLGFWFWFAAFGFNCCSSKKLTSSSSTAKTTQQSVTVSSLEYRNLNRTRYMCRGLSLTIELVSGECWVVYKPNRSFFFFWSSFRSVRNCTKLGLGMAQMTLKAPKNSMPVNSSLLGCRPGNCCRWSRWSSGPSRGSSRSSGRSRSSVPSQARSKFGVKYALLRYTRFGEIQISRQWRRLVGTGDHGPPR